MSMDQASDGMFRPTAEHLSHVYWYLIVGAIGFGLIANALRKGDETIRYVSIEARLRIRTNAI